MVYSDKVSHHIVPAHGFLLIVPSTAKSWISTRSGNMSPDPVLFYAQAKTHSRFSHPWKNISGRTPLKESL